ncbi:hypothetical protein PCANC_14107 [Puccinia coronata f. sp. avenae]|uniref:Uncharacterized protein n=1 Tax=Puccinia coronata f. sp. avenae TaxID=200324 RepID=A0A2N5VRU0_9BASI|nr:hypothetical protein PCANC_14107 [Puccinia coronata f. sp. avenae]
MLSINDVVARNQALNEAFRGNIRNVDPPSAPNRVVGEVINDRLLIDSIQRQGRIHRGQLFKRENGLPDEGRYIDIARGPLDIVTSVDCRNCRKSTLIKLDLSGEGECLFVMVEDSIS